MTNQDDEQPYETVPDSLDEESPQEERRQFLRSLGKWSQAVIGGVVAGGILTTPKPAEAWHNGGSVVVPPGDRDSYRRGGSWGNRGGGWYNRGGGGWGNRGGGWYNRGGGGWGNRGGGWYNRGGGGWHNHGGGWYNRHGGWGNRGGSWYNRHGGWGNR